MRLGLLGWGLAAAAGVALAGGRPGAAQSAPPNIVCILVDDLRWDPFGCMGHPFVKTPHIDRLAREGALFKNAFATTPLCSPARGSLLTGQYVRTHGVRGNGNSSERSHRLVTFPRLLQDGGYETAYVGKWHMGNDGSPRPGFNRWVSFPGQGQHLDPILNVDGKQGKVPGYMTDLLTGHAVDFVKQPHRKPFCLYLAYKAVHGPFIPAERHKALYPDAPIPHPASTQDDNQGKPALIRPVGAMKTPGPGTGAGEGLIRNQLRMLSSVDEGVGQVLQALEDARQLEHTLVVFTSDNGYFWGEHGLGDKRWAYEESIRVPLMMRLPGRIPAGARPEGIALNVDLAPTFLSLAGVPVPKDMQGAPLWPLFTPGGAWRKAAVFEYFAEAAYPRAPTWEALRSNRWKYVRYPELGPDYDELYDLAGDPLEMRNRVKSEDSAEVLKELRADLDRQLRALPTAQ